MENITNHCDFPLTSPDAEDNAKTKPRAFWITVAVLTLAVTMTFLAASVLARQYGDGFLSRRNDTIGELLMQEGDRLEKVGLADAALERYLQAINARFAGEHNRIHTLKRIGFIYRDRGEYERAIEYLRQTVSGAYVSTTSYYALVDALFQLERMDEAESATRDWLRAIEGKGRTREQGRALYYAGRIEELRGRMAAALEAYQKSDVQFGDELSAARLAEHYVEQGDLQQARAALDRYFSRKPSGSLAEEMRSLRAQLANDASGE